MYIAGGHENRAPVLWYVLNILLHRNTQWCTAQHWYALVPRPWTFTHAINYLLYQPRTHQCISQSNPVQNARLSACCNKLKAKLQHSTRNEYLSWKIPGTSRTITSTTEGYATSSGHEPSISFTCRHDLSLQTVLCRGWGKYDALLNVWLKLPEAVQISHSLSSSMYYKQWLALLTTCFITLSLPHLTIKVWYRLCILVTRLMHAWCAYALNKTWTSSMRIPQDMWSWICMMHMQDGLSFSHSCMHASIYIILLHCLMLSGIIRRRIIYILTWMLDCMWTVQVTLMWSLWLVH